MQSTFEVQKYLQLIGLDGVAIGDFHPTDPRTGR